MVTQIYKIRSEILRCLPSFPQKIWRPKTSKFRRYRKLMANISGMKHSLSNRKLHCKQRSLRHVRTWFGEHVVYRRRKQDRSFDLPNGRQSRWALPRILINTLKPCLHVPTRRKLRNLTRRSPSSRLTGWQIGTEIEMGQWVTAGDPWPMMMKYM